MLSGESLPVTLTIGDLPSGVTGELHPATVVPTGTAVLSVTSQLDAPPDDYTIVVTGTDSSQVHTATATLSIMPHPDFALEYAPDLCDELYRLTYGQPYLLQRLCWELINNWNERFLRGGESTPRTLTLDDLAPVLTPDFYQSAGYYFDGVWSNVTEEERALMCVLAGQPDRAWSPGELAQAAGRPVDDIQPVLERLHRHDVIVESEAGVRFASELMRRWVADGRWQAANRRPVARD